MAFTALGLVDYMQRVVEAVTFEEPTPIQAQSIPLILEGNDVVAQAQTGTGKTAAFALPILQVLAELPAKKKAGELRALILAPTRELAQQVADVFNRFGEFMPRDIGTVCLIGGEDINGQVSRLRNGVEIGVATPGRLLELVRERAVSFDDLRFFVIDEADKLLDLGFAEELDELLAVLPAARQSLLFSATYPEKVSVLAQRVLQNPIHVTIEGDAPTVENICQRVIRVNRDNRGPLLRHLLKEEGWKHVLLFVSSKRGTKNLTAKLKRDGIKAGAFHGDLDQRERTDVLRKFKRRSIEVLVATDIAARGIDIQDLAVVVNYDLPRSPVDYIHRIGRTGRAGSSGIAVSFVGHEDQAHFKLIEKRAELTLEREEIAGFELTGEAVERKKGALPVKGKRPSKKDKARAALVTKENDFDPLLRGHKKRRSE